MKSTSIRKLMKEMGVDIEAARHLVTVRQTALIYWGSPLPIAMSSDVRLATTELHQMAESHDLGKLCILHITLYHSRLRLRRESDGGRVVHAS